LNAALVRRSVLVGIGLALVFGAPATRAADRSAESFVAAIYDRYKGRDAKGTALDTPAQVRLYFAPNVAALLLEDRHNARGEVGHLEADPFVDAQDWEIDAFDVAVRHAGPDKATATASFKNTGTPRTVILDLVRLREGWRIAEITWDRNATLRGVLTGK
jgi:hypothetical protein